MKYKALIFDLDGTAIPNRPDGMPSDNLVRVIEQLQQQGIKVCAATGRPRFNSKPITDKLGLTDPCIISGGTQIIDPITEKILWEKDMSQLQVEEITKIALPYPYTIYFSDDNVSAPAKEKKVKGSERIIYIMAVSEEDTAVILHKLQEIPNIVSHKVMSWTKDHFDIHITHSEATKRHALEVLLEILKIHKDDVVAAGDSNNDIPLFELAGYKIAMGNGSSELKAKADVVAPNADKDGLAIAIEKAILHSQ